VHAILLGIGLQTVSVDVCVALIIGSPMENLGASFYGHHGFLRRCGLSMPATSCNRPADGPAGHLEPSVA